MNDEQLALCPVCDNEFDQSAESAIEEFGLVFCGTPCWEAYAREHDSDDEDMYEHQALPR